MGKPHRSEADKEDLDEIVRDLGGDEDDIKYIADADFSGSDYEDSEKKPSDANLADDVAKMWKELNFEKQQPTSKQLKGDKGAKGAKAGKEDTKKGNESKKDLKETKKDGKEIKKETTEVKKEGGNTTTKRTDSRTETANIRNDSRKLVAKQAAPAVPQAISKKTRQAWDSYIASLTHPKTSLVLNSEMQWADLAAKVTEPSTSIHPELVEELKARANQLLESENQAFYRERSSDREFTTSLEFLKSGTFSDQLGTLSLLSTESPLHSVRFLENLANKCEIKNRESACKALEVTKDLLVSHVLPNRRLRQFKEQPLQLNLSQETLIAFAFEDFLKRYFFRLLRVMETLLADTVENIRLRSLHCVFAFFQQKPEQEANLLRLGLNKLGDPAGKVASRVKRLLMDALQIHPGMKPIVATAMAELLGRVSDYRTRYYAVDTMSEFILSNRDPSLANQLIYIYLELFERLLNESKFNNDERKDKPVSHHKPKSGKRMRAKRGKRGGLQQAKADTSEIEAQQHARLVAKIFTGLNRAFPFSNLDPQHFGKYMDTLYQMSHSPNVGTFIEALSFIFQLSKAQSTAAQSGNSATNTDISATTSRYYRALYDSLLDTRLPHSSKLAKYVHLVIRSLAALKSENDVATANAFAKRTLQVACNISEVGAVASLIHAASLAPHGERLIERQDRDTVKDEYDSKKRDPRYAKAETSQAWELLLLQQHFHPTVSLYANNILADENERVALDMPDIEQYSVNSFLSKWSYKKPKAKETGRGGSIFQPLAGFTDLTLGIRQQKRGDDTPASMQDWKNKNLRDVAPEEMFLYEYFRQKPEKKSKAKSSADGDKAKAGDEDDSDAESIAEDEINEAMSRSGPGDLGGADINASDLDEDSEDYGDLEADLENAFRSGDEDEDGDAAGADDLADLGDSDEEGLEGGASEGEDHPELDVQDDFAQMDGLGNNDGKKRKRAWSKYPTFLDADAFEEMYGENGSVAEKKSSKKKRH